MRPPCAGRAPRRASALTASVACACDFSMRVRVYRSLLSAWFPCLTSRVVLVANIDLSGKRFDEWICSRAQGRVFERRPATEPSPAPPCARLRVRRRDARSLAAAQGSATGGATSDRGRQGRGHGHRGRRADRHARLLMSARGHAETINVRTAEWRMRGARRDAAERCEAEARGATVCGRCGHIYGTPRGVCITG